MNENKKKQEKKTQALAWGKNQVKHVVNSVIRIMIIFF